MVTSTAGSGGRIEVYRTFVNSCTRYVEEGQGQRSEGG